MKMIKCLSGYSIKDVTWENMSIVSEIKTGGDDYSGYKNKQTFGLALNQFSNPVLYVGSVDAYDLLDHCPAIVFGDGVQMRDVPGLLRTLADSLEK